MFHFGGFPRTRSPWIVTALIRQPGFPIRISSDQRLLTTSPGLFAGCYVLHRLFVSRHPPCALELLSLPLKHENVLGCHILRYDIDTLDNRVQIVIVFTCCRGSIVNVRGTVRFRSGKRRGNVVSAWVCCSTIQTVVSHFRTRSIGESENRLGAVTYFFFSERERPRLK